LRTLLTEPSKGLTLNEDNYEAAVQLLQECFGKPKHIINAYTEELIKLSSCTLERPSSMRFVYDKVTVYVKGLAALGIKSDQYSSLLVPIVMTKLPSDLCLRFIHDSDKEVWEIDELMGVLQKEVEARESTDLVKSCGPKSQTPKPPPALPPSASSLLLSSSVVKCV